MTHADIVSMFLWEASGCLLVCLTFYHLFTLRPRS